MIFPEFSKALYISFKIVSWFLQKDKISPKTIYSNSLAVAFNLALSSSTKEMYFIFPSFWARISYKAESTKSKELFIWRIEIFVYDENNSLKRLSFCCTF